MDKWIEKIHSIRTFISRERKKKKKKTKKGNEEQSPLSLSLSLSFPLFLLSVFPRTTREGNEREDYPISANILSPCTTRHDVAISSHVEPRLREKKRRVQVSGSTSEVTRRVEVGWWLTLSLRASRRRRHLCATPPLFQRPPRHTDPYRRIYTPPPPPSRMCFVPAPTDKLSPSLGRAPERSRTQGWWPAVTHPSAGCHSIYSLEDRARGRRGWWNSGRMGGLGKMRTGDI